MRVRFWGTRGSIATPGAGTVRYGGNTACVEVRSAQGALVVLDCGTGARALGLALAAEPDPPSGGDLLISHTHWDHIQGLPFFGPLFTPGQTWRLHGPRGLGQSLAQTLEGQMQYEYFPVAVDQLGAAVTFHDLVEGCVSLGEVEVTAQYVNHPALTLAYRLECDGATLVYSTDHEPYDRALAPGGDVLASPSDARHVDFLRGADVVIHDAQYLATEYDAKVGWGHSTVEYVVDCARLADVAHLVLFHHDPTRDDFAVDRLLVQARAHADRTGYAGVIDAAAEGLVLDLSATRDRTVVLRPGSATFSPDAAALSDSVFVATTDEALRSAIEAAAGAESLFLVPELDEPDRTVVVVDADQSASPDLLEPLRRLLAPATASGSAVLALTRGRPTTVLDGLVTDWLVWPASLRHVRTKLRAAVLRTACRWQSAPLPTDEPARLRALHDLGLLDTPAEERFDRWTRQACEDLDVPTALITLVDSDRQWFKSRHGAGADSTPRDESICAHAILGPDLFEVTDLLDDDRFADSPAAARGTRYYAGVPLTAADGQRVGMLCVTDRRPRSLTPHQTAVLRELADHVQQEIDVGSAPETAPAR